jgi:hypothetical protein
VHAIEIFPEVRAGGIAGLPRPVACGMHQAASDRATLAGSAVKATTSPKAPPSAEDQEMRFIGLVGQAIDACSPDAPGDKGGEGVPVP